PCENFHLRDMRCCAARSALDTAMFGSWQSAQSSQSLSFHCKFPEQLPEPDRALPANLLSRVCLLTPPLCQSLRSGFRLSARYSSVPSPKLLRETPRLERGPQKLCLAASLHPQYRSRRRAAKAHRLSRNLRPTA